MMDSIFLRTAFLPSDFALLIIQNSAVRDTQHPKKSAHSFK